MLSCRRVFPEILRFQARSIRCGAVLRPVVAPEYGGGEG